MFLLPSEPLNTSKVDSDFKNEWEALTKMDFKVFLYDHDQFVRYRQLISNIDFSQSGQIILRSWMLKESEYHELWSILHRNKFELINTPEQYLNCHHYPNVYKHIKNWCPDSIWFDDITESVVEICRKHIGSDIIIKDYVKSEKGDDELFLLTQDLSSGEFFERVLKFKESRGKLFNQGIVFKKCVNLRKYGNKTNEWRVFVYDGKIISFSQNTELGYGQQPVAPFLQQVISSIDSKFYTIDVAELENGEWIILECGDGQVSGLSPGQSEWTFYSNFLNLDEIKH